MPTSIELTPALMREIIMAISYGSLLEPYEAKFSSNGEKTISPYDRYLKRRRVGAIIKLSLFLIAIVGMLVWYYIAFIRS